MSVFNGHKDILVEQVGHLFRLDGLSQAGFDYLHENFSYAARFNRNSVSNIIQQILDAGLSVEVR